MSETKTMYENQRTITTHKVSHNNGKPPFGIFDNGALETAMQILKPTTFKLWCYFNKNQIGYEFALSKVAVTKFCRMSNDSYHKGFKELLDAGYLVQTGNNTYDFYELPQEREEEKPLITKKPCKTAIMSNEIAEVDY